jgi:CheY-like chemotaxis protein
VVDDLLDMARITTGKLTLEPQPVHLAGLVRAALDVVRPAALAKRQRIHVGVDDEAIVVQGDAARLQQVAWNLLSNAVKFTPDGGAVSVQVATLEGLAVISVTDTGVGIAPEFLPHVFDRFTQADQSSTRNYPGLGLGLAIVRHLVELHGGSVSATSMGVGQGTTFTVELPVADHAAPAASPPALQPDVRVLAGCHVLVVDDDVEARSVASAVLESAGVQVVSARSVDEAEAALGRQTFNAVVCDIGMPGQDGYAFVANVRRSLDVRTRQIAVMALTGYAGAMNERIAHDAGFDAHLAKPVAPADLLMALARLVSAGQAH